MRNCELERALKRVAKQTPVMPPERKEQNIERLIEVELPVQMKGDLKEFVISQIGFLNKNVMFWYILWAVCFVALLRQGELLQMTNQMLSVLSMAPPLLLLLTVEEVTRVYQRSMLEIEYATKYSLKKLVMTRLLILSIVNGSLVLIGILIAKQQLGLRLIEVFLYGITPLILMSCILLWVMKHWQGERLKYAAFTIYIVFGIGILVGGMERFNIYAQSAMGIWGVIFIVGMLGMLFQLHGLRKYLSHFELVMEE